MSQNFENMEITRNMFVSLTYELKTGSEDGEIKEKAVADSPLDFLFGAGLMLPSFEEKVEGLKTGDSYQFSLPADEAYGPKFPDRIVELPISIFQVDGKIDEEMLVVGESLPMMDSSGNRLNGLILEITDENVKMDFNHPLAGEDLFFKGEILEVREATEAEIMEAVGGGGCGSGCGCGSGEDSGCGSGGCSTESAASSGGGCGSGCGCS